MPVWFDVGAHLGETTLKHALTDPSLTVYAFEPIPELARKLDDMAPDNYHVYDDAIDESFAVVPFYVHGANETSSLLPFNEEGKAAWGASFGDTNIINVKTFRLDWFMDFHNIDRVDYIKIDTQGNDLAVVRSLGERIKDVDAIMAEVQLQPLYRGAATKDEMLAYMTEHDFVLTRSTVQTRGKEENLYFERRP